MKKKRDLWVLSEADAAGWMDMPKRAHPASWYAPANRVDTRLSVFGLLDPEEATIPGLTVQIEYRTGGRIAGRHMVVCSLMLEHAGRRTRVYQLEVAPAGQYRHRSAQGAITGTNERIGGETYGLPADMHQRDFQWLIQWFCQRIHLQLSEPMQDPLSFLLQ